MKKSSTNGLMTLCFGRMCAANLLLFASVYMLLPFLPLEMSGRVGITLPQVGNALLMFLLGLFVAGPFHAYLGDTYKRKGVLLLATLGVLAITLGYTFVDSYPHLLALAAAQGVCFGLAATAGITVAIDITTSARRSEGNRLYAWAARLGILVGVVAGICLYRLYGFRMVVYGAVACAVASMLLASRVYVAFRAPIGVPLLNLDRFLLPSGWLPAINVALIAFLPGVWLPLLPSGCYGGVVGLVALLFFTTPFIRMFVRLSHHCQRGTANTTCHLAMETGLLLGMVTACRLFEPSLMVTESIVYPLAGGIGLFAFLLLTPTYLYYKKKRVR